MKQNGKNRKSKLSGMWKNVDVLFSRVFGFNPDVYIFYFNSIQIKIKSLLYQIVSRCFERIDVASGNVFRKKILVGSGSTLSKFIFDNEKYKNKTVKGHT